MLPINTVLFSSRAPIGYVAIAGTEVCTNQGFKNMICDEVNSHYKFIYYWLKANTEQIEKLSSGSTFSEASASLMRSLPINLPTISEQKEIAAILSSLDDKIELLRKQNETLEKTAQTIFQEWFGKYSIDDELPEGWRVGKLEEIATLQWWFVHNTSITWNTVCYIAKMGVVNWKDWFNRDSVLEYSETPPDKHKLVEDDIIICTRDVTQDRVVIWNVALVPKDLADYWIYAWANTWILKSSYNKYFLFMLLRAQEFRDHIIQSAKWSTIVMITKDAFLEREIIIPDNESLALILEKITSFLDKIKINSLQIQSLSKTRDTLLPKLMGGEVRVGV